ncbi:FKBP-type peptidyl-prolyl cis-trans isomerase [Psychrosphaera algicola]|uniref:FKBP-type peptidyl-prolyl cis-trans isomerase n=1 Tax=Psychrosphaera algicola TaxID=3023714 RepID=UPI002FEE0888
MADGSVIADTYRTGLADEFSLEEAIEGLKLGLPLMSVGSRYEFVIPLNWLGARKVIAAKLDLMQSCSLILGSLKLFNEQKLTMPEATQVDVNLTQFLFVINLRGAINNG